MEEKTFFENDGVKITNARFVVDKQTFAMSNITSIATGVEQPKLFWWMLAVMLCLLYAINRPIIGLTLAAVIGYMMFTRNSNTYHVLLRTSGGETKALSSKEKDYVEQVVAALNEAIIHRG